MTCGKIIYPSMAKAQDAGRRISKKNKSIKLRSYYCYECDGYHTTSMTKKKFSEQYDKG